MYKDISTIENYVTDLDALKNSIRNILLTKKGSLPGKPTFGSDLYRIIFKPLDHLTISIAKNYIEEALTKFEDRIVVEEIQMKKVEEFNKLIIDIYFSYTDDSLNEIQDSTALSINL